MASDKRDYYEVLGIPRDATKDDMRSAYRKLARQLPPRCEQRARRRGALQRDQRGLPGPQRRGEAARYDRYGHAGHRQTAGGAGGFGFGGFEDIFEDSLALACAAARGRGRAAAPICAMTWRSSLRRRSLALQQEIEIGRLEAVPHLPRQRRRAGHLAHALLRLRRHRPDPPRAAIDLWLVRQCDHLSPLWRARRGRSPRRARNATAQQRVEQTRKLQVDVPAGVDDGTRIRLSGEGEAGGDGGPAGNLYVVLHVKPHPYFARRDDDILLNMNINIAQAALGDEIRCPLWRARKSWPSPPAPAGHRLSAQGQGRAPAARPRPRRPDRDRERCRPHQP